MASIQNDVRRFTSLNTSFDSNVAATSSGVLSPTNAHTQYEARVYKTKIALSSLTLTVDVASGGQADGIGQKIGSLPEGGIAILGAQISGVLTPAAGTSGSSVKIGLGTAAAGNADASLTSTEQDILASANLGDGTLVASTAETISNFGGPASGALWLDGSASAKDIYLNIAGTFTKASGSTSTLALTGVEITILWTWIGDD